MIARKRRKIAKTPKQPAMRITRQRREMIGQLANALAALAPATSRFKGFCVRNVAEEHGLKKYWKSGGNKRTMIALFLEEVLRQYSRKPKTVVMAIVRSSLDWRVRKGEATTIEELEAVATPMEALGFDIRKDIKKIELPEPSRVCAPAQDKVVLIELLELHDHWLTIVWRCSATATSTKRIARPWNGSRNACRPPSTTITLSARR